MSSQENMLNLFQSNQEVLNLNMNPAIWSLLIK
jgi:hypothetical protein